MTSRTLPKGWKEVELGSLLKRSKRPVDLASSTMYREIGIRSHGKGIFHKEERTGESIGEKSVFWVEPDCFIVNIVFAWEQAIAKTTVKEKGMIASHRFPMYKPIEGKLNLDYLVYFFKSSRGKYLLGLASPGGAGRNKTLGQQEFLNLTIPLPPYSEQCKIVDILLSSEKAIALTEQLIHARRNIKKGYEQHLISGKTRFPGFNAKWNIARLSNLGSTYSGLSGKTKDDFGSGKPYITYKNIFENSKVDISKLDFVQIHDGERQNKAQLGDVFFTSSSETPNEVGMSSVLLDHLDECYLNSFCFGFRLNDFDHLTPEYARFLFRSGSFRKNFFKLAQGSTRYNISKGEVLKLSVELPTIKEQKKISEILAICDKIINLQGKRLEALKQQRKGLSQKLLTGQIRVKV